MSFSAAVIGAGPAGIAATHALRSVGAMVTCFEVHSQVGGIWNTNGADFVGPRGINSPIYPTMRCVLPKDLMAFSDQRFAFFVPQFPHHSAVGQYLREYSELKGVTNLVRFNTKVENVVYDEVRRCWKLTSVNFINGDVFEWYFDSVVVATGRTHEPRYPDDLVPADGSPDRLNRESFIAEGGSLWHSSEAKRFRDFAKKRVIVVGDGVGAYCHCMELQAAGATVFHSTTLQRTPTRPGEADGGDSIPEGWSLASMLEKAPVDAGQHRGRELLCKWLRFYNRAVLNCPRIGPILQFNGRAVTHASDPTANVTPEQMRLLRGAATRLQKERAAMLKDKPEAAAGAAAGTDVGNVLLTEDELAGRVATLPDIDAVIYATGYHLRFPFLEKSIRSQLEDDPVAMLSSVTRRPVTATPAAPTPPTPRPVSEEASSSASTQASADASHEGTTHAHAEELAAAEVEKQRRANGTAIRHRGLYAGVVFVDKPTLGFVGLPNDLIPPFMVFEAQARYLANLFSRRSALPPDSETMMREREASFQSIYTARGAGLDTIAYYDKLYEEAGCPTRTWLEDLYERKWWFLGSTFLTFVHKVRSMAPLKRKQQHIIISNKI